MRWELINFGRAKLVFEVFTGQSVRFVVVGQRQQTADARQVNVCLHEIGEQIALACFQAAHTCIGYSGLIRIDQAHCVALALQRLANLLGNAVCAHDQESLRVSLADAQPARHIFGRSALDDHRDDDDDQ